MAKRTGETFFLDDGAAFVRDNRSWALFKMVGNKRVRITDPRIAVKIESNSSVISEERAKRIASSARLTKWGT